VALRHIDIVSVPVADQDRARRFYTEMLDFTVAVDDDSGADRWVMLTPPGGGAKITLVTWFPTMPPGTLKGLVLSCTGIEGTYKLLAERGAKLTPHIETADWARWFGLNDPDGNGIVIQEES
jgi:catechol 2,3-dioxygenase-like lactoylglutathione lyase family enzyme